MIDNAQVLAEIARLHGELQRIQHELEILRRHVESPSSRRTRAFGMSPKDAPTGEIAAQAPQPAVRLTSETLPSQPRVTGRRTGLTDPQAQPERSSTGRRAALPDPQAGRYGMVEEGRPAGRRR
ncbi:MAG: hypothetical protein HYV09_21260 [Deltaproteobacteria bacterium]|nr:hypothetical protein [Deltaproteobacteria bacterium]